MNSKMTGVLNRRRWITVMTLVGAAGLAGAGLRPDDERPESPEIPLEVLDSMKTLPGDIGALPPVTSPADNPTTPEKIALGKRLFFDTRFSRDYTTSCATCHSPEAGFADGKPLAIGFEKKVLGRHTPTVLNTAYNTAQFWDGRALTLEEQAQGPIMAAGEMNMGTEQVVVERIMTDKAYVQQFKEIFNSEPTLPLIGKGIAAYERTIVTPNTRFDAYAKGTKNALTDSEKRGLLVFVGKASCTQCHSGPNFTDNKFHNLGVHKAGADDQDPGRYKVTTLDADRGAFKTPSVREALRTAPFMHDGSIATIEELVEFYNKGGGEGANKSKLMFPLNLTEREKSDLVAFIKSLSGTIVEPGSDVAGAESIKAGDK